MCLDSWSLKSYEFSRDKKSTPTKIVPSNCCKMQLLPSHDSFLNRPEKLSSKSIQQKFDSAPQIPQPWNSPPRNKTSIISISLNPYLPPSAYSQFHYYLFHSLADNSSKYSRAQKAKGLIVLNLFFFPWPASGTWKTSRKCHEQKLKPFNV